MTEQIFDYIQYKLKRKHTKFIYEISEVLETNYDAAYRRILGKVQLNPAELKKLALYYNFSIDEVLLNEERKKFLIDAPLDLLSGEDFINYVHLSNNTIRPFITQKNSKSYYMAKDIPLFYTLGENKITKLKIFIWLYLKNKEFAMMNIKFKDFHPPIEAIKHSNTLISLYDHIDSVEIWNESTINSLIGQTEYLFTLELINKIELESILNDIQQQLKYVCKLAENGKKATGKSFELLENNLLVMDNIALFRSDENKLFFLPFNMIDYFIVKDRAICSIKEDYIQSLIEHSNKLSLENKENRENFFNKLNHKVQEMHTKYL